VNTNTATLLDRPHRVGASDPPNHQGRTTRPVWSPWPTVPRPATAAHEQTFVQALTDAAERAGGPVEGEPSRPDVTLLLNALRCGVTVAQLGEMAPGMRPERLLGAYLGLEAARQRSARAWRLISRAAEHRPGIDEADRASAAQTALRAHAAEASRLLPTIVVRLVDIAKRRPSDLADAVHRATVEVSVQAAHVRRIEAAIERVAIEYPAGVRADEWAAELGGLLYDPFGEAVANRPDYLPERVGLLTPTRVAALLNERPLPNLT